MLGGFGEKREWGRAMMIHYLSRLIAIICMQSEVSFHGCHLSFQSTYIPTRLSLDKPKYHSTVWQSRNDLQSR